MNRPISDYYTAIVLLTRHYGFRGVVAINSFR